MLKVYVLPIAAAVWPELRDGSACGERGTLLSQRNSLYISGTDSVKHNSVFFRYQVQSQLTSPIHMLYISGKRTPMHNNTESFRCAFLYTYEIRVPCTYQIQVHL
jgi:hypothetical protein